MHLNVSKLEFIRLRCGNNDGYSSYINYFYRIAIDYPERWTVKFMDRYSDLVVYFLRHKAGGAPFIKLSAFPMDHNRRTIPQLQEYAHQFARANKLTILKEYETQIGHDGTGCYVMEYIEKNANNLITKYISFLEQNNATEYQILCCFREKDCDTTARYPFNTDAFDRALESVRFVSDENMVEKLPPVFYFDAAYETYTCSVCGKKMEQLHNPCPTPACSAIRTGVWCQNCGFINSVDLFITNRHYCANCGQLVDARKITSPGHCFIATAAYGTPCTIELQILKQFRDDHLLKNAFGRLFVYVYYQVSPTIASFIEKHEIAKSLTRTILIKPILLIIKNLGVYRR